MTYYTRIPPITPVKKSSSDDLFKSSNKTVAREKVYKDDPLIMDTFGTGSRLTAAEKQAQDTEADRHLMMKI